MDSKKLSEAIQKAISEVVGNKKMSLDLAKKVSEKIREKAKEIGVNAVVAISDEGARPILVECMDNSYIASYDIAVNKAYTTVALKMSTKTLKGLAQPGQSLYGIQFTNNSKIVIFGGGETLEGYGKILGGLGVSGGTEEQDTYLAEYGKEVFRKIIEERSF